MLVASDWYEGLKYLLCCLFGSLAIRKAEGFSLQQVFCFTIFSGLQLVWSICNLATGLARVKNSSSFVSAWQARMHDGLLFVAPPLTLFAMIVGRQLYEEMRITGNVAVGRVINRQERALPVNRVEAGPEGVSLWSHNVSNPGPNPFEQTNFKPFSGEGHRLGTAANNV